MTAPLIRKPFVLIIMDGIGLNPNPRGNAVFHAHPLTLTYLQKSYPNTTLITCGSRVGLPEGQMGNSEVGHLNIGGGRVVEQELTRIDKAIANDSLQHLPGLIRLFNSVRSRLGSALHLVGLVSHGGVHSSLEHLKALIKAAVRFGVENIFVHAITDGRDRPPSAALEEIGNLVNFLNDLNQATSPGQNKPKKDLKVSIGSIIGRYYAMDRDTRWDRTQRAYDLLTLGKGEVFQDPIQALQKRKEQGQQDEFLEPILIAGSATRPPLIGDDDGVLFFNFRADRMRQLVSAIISNEDSFQAFQRQLTPKLASVTTLTEYKPSYKVEVLFRPPVIENHLGEVLSKHNFSQLRIAETEKYPHVTYFFNGGLEHPYPGEKRLLIPSPRDVPTYDYKPEMSAYEVTEELLRDLRTGTRNVIIVNFANGDMVGHTGSFEAAVKAVEAVDICVGKVVGEVLRLGGGGIVTADHGNAEQMIDYVTGKPHTFHTMNPVPFVIFGERVSKFYLRKGGALCDIAPTALELLGLAIPQEMTGVSLLVT